MLFHSFMKICSFFCAGAVIYKTGRNYVYELDGLGRKMPKVFVTFTVSSLALMGVPGLCGFVSKWNLCRAAVDSENLLAYAGVAALMVSALLTAIYMLTMMIRAFFPGRDFDYGKLSEAKDPNWLMLLPLTVFVAVMFYFGLRSGPVTRFLQEIAGVVRF